MYNTLYKVIGWAEFVENLKTDFNIVFKTIDDVFVNNPRLHQWDEIEESEIFDMLERLNCFEGELCVITDVSYRKNMGPFKVNSEKLEEFINKHDELFGESFLDTDILIFSQKQRIIWVIHHEGIYSAIYL